MKASIIIVLISLAVVHQVTPAGIEQYTKKSCSDANFNKTSGTAFSLDYCKTLDFGTGIYRCCYAHAKVDGNTVRGCLALSYSEFNDIDKYKDSKKEDGYSDFSIDCNSKYLTIAASFFALVIALL